MTQDPLRPIARRTSRRARSPHGGVVSSAAIALLVLSGCAAVPMQRPASRTATAESVERPESAAEPQAPRSGDEAPPDSSDVPSPAATPRTLIVKASAYNSRRGQTDSTPSVGAWGDRLEPGMKVIAVSKDLFELGLRRGQRVTIAGMPGEYVVLDRMPSRWQQKIDIYMGHDVRAALRWGIRQVEISWIPEEGTAIDAGEASGGDSEGRPGAGIGAAAD